MRHHPPTKKGFTLVEILLYTSVAAVVLTSASVFLFVVLQTRVKHQVISEVEQQGVQVMQVITQTARNATVLTAPAAGASAASLTLQVPNGTLSPTIFTLSSGAIRITEGAAPAEVLTNTRVVASNLRFTNLSHPGTPGSFRVEFTLAAASNSSRSEYTYAQTFTTAASLRHP